MTGPEAWEREIRGWLLGRLGKNPTAGASSPSEAILGGRALAWWIFEGKRHRFLGGSLAERVDLAGREARRLDLVLSPEWRSEESPAAETDWMRTALSRATEPEPRFVVRSSSAGLTDLERQALRAWLRWTADLWDGYTAELGVPAGAPEKLPWRPRGEAEPVTERHLHRWAQASRRSRWPLLREVVAESFRAAVEPESLDRLPLPSVRDTLFELLCVVRVLSALAGPSRHVRWLGQEESENSISIPGVTCKFQGGLGGARLSDVDLGTECVRAIGRHGVTLPCNYDALFVFDPPRIGFHGLLLEAKSGDQSFATTLHQLRSYRAALRATFPGPLVIWGIVEGGGVGPGKVLDPVALANDLALRAPGDDFWLFTTAEEIGAALETMGLEAK